MPKFVKVRQGGDTGPVVEVSEAFAQCLDLTPLDSVEESPKPSARRRAAKPSHESGSDAAPEPTPEEASK